MSTDPLLPDPAHLRTESLGVDANGVVITLSVIATAASCPLCRRSSERMHSRYVRRLADLPWRGVAVSLRLHMRRFFCDAADCRRRIFAERLPEVAPAYARRTARLTEVLRAVGFAAGGEGGVRLLLALALQTSADTLLRLLRAAPMPDRPPVRVLGVDDWAKKRGQAYGTILVDLERHTVVDLLPDRTAEGFRDWLTQHPGVEVISRDRGGAYADGARQGAPEAVQVSDRWHLLKNLGDALERTLEREHRALRDVERELSEPTGTTAAALPSGGEGAAATPPPTADTPTGEPTPRPEEGEQEATPRTRVEEQRDARRERRRRRVEEAVARQREGVTITAIGRELGVTRKTVRRWLRAGEYRERAAPPRRPGVLAPHEDYLRERWDAGCHNVAQLFRELRERGYAGSNSHLRHFLAHWREHPARTKRPDRGDRAPERGRPLTPRRARWLLLRRPEERDDADRATVAAIERSCPIAAEGRRLVAAFQALVHERDADGLEGWLRAAEASAVPELRTFAQGVRRDRAAVEAALQLPWSQGQVEGQVNKLKTQKRAMFGRAGFELLRHRLLAG
jgi:transposase